MIKEIRSPTDIILISLGNQPQIKKEFMKENLTGKLRIVSCPQYFSAAKSYACAAAVSSS